MTWLPVVGVVKGPKLAAIVHESVEGAWPWPLALTRVSENVVSVVSFVVVWIVTVNVSVVGTKRPLAPVVNVRCATFTGVAVAFPVLVTNVPVMPVPHVKVPWREDGALLGAAPATVPAPRTTAPTDRGNVAAAARDQRVSRDMRFRTSLPWQAPALPCSS